MTRSAATLVQLSDVREALWVFQLEHGRFPTQDEGFAVLQPYLRAPKSTDPWGNPFIYVPDYLPEPIVLSYGADGKPGGSDADADLSTEWFTREQ